MDGTIVDTEPHWQTAQRAILDEYGLPQFDDAAEEALVGASLATAARIFRDAGVPLGEDEWIARVAGDVERLVQGELEPRPGARELLTALRDAGIPCALVTNSYRGMVDVVLDALAGDWFTAVVTGDDVRDGKPHPEPYRRGAELLGVDPVDCVAIEDSVTGLASARAAGMVTLGVPHGMRLDETQADELRPTLAGTTVDDLRALHARARRTIQEDAR